MRRAVAIVASLITAGAAVAQHDATAEKPAKQPEAPAAAPSSAAEDGMYEAPDGTKMKVVKKSSVSLTVEIEDLKLGEGKECPMGATVMVNYHGTLRDGKVFDTTRGKDKPVSFSLKQIIPGWQLGVPGMKIGGIRRLVVPHQLAYGEQEFPGPDGQILIPSRSDLVFSIELLAIDGKDAQGNPYPPKEKALSHVETKSGLIIEDLKVGDGAECPQNATVVCHYRGTLAVDGRQFDSSYDRGQPATFPLSGVIKGWQEGIPGMKTGGKRRLIIPADLAYGANPPRGSIIPPNAMLEFEVELVEIKN